MTEQQKSTQDNLRTPWENMPFAEMKEKMMGQQGEGCGCADMMSQMMSICGNIQEKGETEESVEKAV